MVVFLNEFNFFFVDAKLFSCVTLMNSLRVVFLIGDVHWNLMQNSNFDLVNIVKWNRNLLNFQTKFSSLIASKLCRWTKSWASGSSNSKSCSSSKKGRSNHCHFAGWTVSIMYLMHRRMKILKKTREIKLKTLTTRSSLCVNLIAIDNRMLFFVTSITNIKIKVSDVVSSSWVDRSKTLLELFIASAMETCEEVVVLQSVFLFTRCDVIAMIMLSTHLSVSSSLPKSSKPSAVLPGPHLTWHLKWFQVKSSDDFSYHFVPGKLKLIRSSACRFRSIAVLLISESVPNVISGLSDCLDITNCTETKKTKNLKNISNESEKEFDEERKFVTEFKANSYQT